MTMQLVLDYTLAEGWIAPYLAGLRAGQAVAARCTRCDRVSFPPARACDCGCTHNVWLTLDGAARVLWRATGLDGDFALLRFSGADTASVARMQATAPDQTNVRIIPAPADRPGLVVAGAPA